MLLDGECHAQPAPKPARKIPAPSRRIFRMKRSWERRSDIEL
jgi:hypothetical protein